MNLSDNETGPGPEVPNQEFLAEFEKAIKSFAEATNTGNNEEAEKAAMSAFLLAGMEAAKNPTPDLRLQSEASDYEVAGNWSAAEAVYLKLITLQEQSGNFGLMAKPHLDLSRLYRHIGELERAWEYGIAGTAAAKKSGIYPLIAKALENQAITALARGDIEAALAASAEAVQVIEPDKIAEVMRAHALTLQAQCLLASGNCESAEKGLQSAWAILGTRTGSGFIIGPVVATSKWWEVRAALLLKREALAEAAEALTRAIDFRREALTRAVEISPYAQASLAELLEQYAALSRRMKKHSEEQQASTEAKDIRNRIHLRARTT